MTDVYLVHSGDNVATALTDIPAGPAHTIGAERGRQIEVSQPVRAGHKIAMQPIRPGEPVVKYGAVIGLAQSDIQPGEWVHVHNMRSQFDQRSAMIDPDSGMAMDTVYE